MTKPYADPFNVAPAPGSEYLQQINYLEGINIVIDKVALDELPMMALEVFSGELFNAGVNQVAGAGVDQLESARNYFNTQIDQLLQQAAALQRKP